MRSMMMAMATAILPCVAMAEDTGLKSLDTMETGRQWMAVGRLDIDDTGFCTGSLISPNLVLTAAHCLYDKTSRERIDPAKIQFLAGWRLGRASAYRAARRAVVHPEYRYDQETTAEGMRHDIALIELWQPVRTPSIVPFETGDRPKRGDEVGVVSYAQDRSEAPSLQEVCSIVSRQLGILVMSCDVDLGSSGAPVFSFEGESPRIVSVVSAKAEVSGKNVALGTPVGDALQVLQAELSAGRGLGSSSGASGANKNIGARFIKP